MKYIVFVLALLCGRASAQEYLNVPGATLLEYQKRIADVYIPMGLSSDQIVEYTRRYFGRDFNFVENNDGSVDFFYVQRKEGAIVMYYLLVSIASAR